MHKYHRAKLTPVGVHECYLVKLLSNIEYHVTIVFLSLETNKRRIIFEDLYFLILMK